MMQTAAVVATPSPRVTEVPKDANALLTPYTLGEFELSHRVVLAPLTRCRAIGELHATSLQSFRPGM
jgi:12-oxophytodienoic acid reductase